MNRQDLIAELARIDFPTKAAAERAVDAVLRVLESGLKRDRRVVISGFGSFRVTHMPAADRRNPRTGETVRVKPRRKVMFRASPSLKGRM